MNLPFYLDGFIRESPKMWWRLFATTTEVFHRFSPELFDNPENMTVKGYIARRMNASSTIFQKSTVVRVSIMICGFLQLRMRRPSTSMLRYSKDTVLRSAKGHGLSPHIIPTSMSRGTCFANSFFVARLRAFLSLSDCAEAPTIVSSYIGSRGKSTISGLGPGSVSRIMFSFANSANLYCTRHFSQRRRRSGVGLSQKASIPSGVRLVHHSTAPCRTLVI